MIALQYKQATEKELPSIIELLQKNDLPSDDLRTSSVQLLVAVHKEELLGCIGLEHFQTEGLLRSFAVEDAYKNQGIGTQLWEKFIPFCKERGIQNLHLLTLTAENYFLKKGFQKVDRIQAPISIQNTHEFTSACPATAVYMQLENPLG